MSSAQESEKLFNLKRWQMRWVEMTCHLQTTTKRIRLNNIVGLIQSRKASFEIFSEAQNLANVIAATKFQVQLNVRLRVTRDSLIIRNSFVIILSAQSQTFLAAKFSGELIMLLCLNYIRTGLEIWSNFSFAVHCTFISVSWDLVIASSQNSNELVCNFILRSPFIAFIATRESDSFA